MAKTLSLKLTDKAIRQHQASLDVYQLKDPSKPLYLRFSTDRQRASWLYVHYKKSSQIRRKIGCWPALNCKQLYQALPEVERTLIYDTKPKRLDSVDTVGDLVGWHLARLSQDRSLSDPRKQQLKSIYTKHLLPNLAQAKVSELTVRYLDDALMQNLQGDYKPATVRLIFQALKALTAQATTRTLIAADPLKGVVFKQFHRGTIVPKGCALTRPEGLELVKAFKENTAAGRLGLLLLCYGTRIGETRLARFRDLDWEARLWHIPAAHTKTRQAYALPITDKMKSYFHDWRKQSGEYLLGQKFSARDASRLIQSLSGGAWSAHDLRKYARSRWQEQGVDYFVAERLLNHSQSRLDSTYLHGALEQQQRSALEQYHAFIGL